MLQMSFGGPEDPSFLSKQGCMGGIASPYTQPSRTIVASHTRYIGIRCCSATTDVSCAHPFTMPHAQLLNIAHDTRTNSMPQTFVDIYILATGGSTRWLTKFG